MDGRMKYTIQDVSRTVKDVNTKFGEMKVFKLQLEGENDEVDYMTSPKSPIPRVGDILEGTIGHNDYGAFFKKDRKPFEPQASKPVANTDAMYVAYAKDIMIAYMNALNWDFDKLDEVQLNLALQFVAEGAKTLSGKQEEVSKVLT